MVSECEAHSEADNDTIDDVDLTAHAEYAGSVNGRSFDNFQLSPLISRVHRRCRWCDV